MTNQTTENQTVFVREVRAQYTSAQQPRFRVSHPGDAARFIHRILPDNSREHFVTLHLDGAHQVIAYSVTATGTANGCVVHPREVFQTACLVGAVAVIVGHNHPSGNVLPSALDESLTKALREVGDMLRLKVLDHVIVTEDQFYSFDSKTTAIWSMEDVTIV